MRGVLVFVLVVGICVAGMGATDTQVAEYQRGFADGQREGRSDVSWIYALWGFFTKGIHALFVSVIPGEEIPYKKLILFEEESQSYKCGLMDGYKDGYRRQRADYSTSGAFFRLIILPLLGQLSAS